MQTSQKTTKRKILIIAPRHYIEELKAHYRNSKFEIAYYVEEKITNDNFDNFLRKIEPNYQGFVGLADYSSLVAAWLNKRQGNPCPEPNLIATLQDKYLSRQLQNKLGLYTNSIRKLSDIKSIDSNDFPLFVKPRRSSMSWMANQANNIQELDESINPENQEKLSVVNKRWADLYNQLKLPDSYTKSLNDFVIEPLIPYGLQVTLDGYVQNGFVDFFGFTKSVFQENHISFKRFDFPFHFSKKLDKNIRKHAEKIVVKSGFDNSLFNIEYKVDEETGRFTLIEVNTRPSSQFMYPIEIVTGVNPLDFALDIVANNTISHQPLKTGHKMCSVCVLRRNSDGEVMKIPSQSEMSWLKNRFNSDRWKSFALKGECLSQHPNDSYTFRFAEVVVPHRDTVLVHDYEEYVERKMNSLFRFR